MTSVGLSEEICFSKILELISSLKGNLQLKTQWYVTEHVIQWSNEHCDKQDVQHEDTYDPGATALYGGFLYILI